MIIGIRASAVLASFANAVIAALAADGGGISGAGAAIRSIPLIRRGDDEQNKLLRRTAAKLDNSDSVVDYETFASLGSRWDPMHPLRPWPRRSLMGNVSSSNISSLEEGGEYYAGNMSSSNISSLEEGGEDYAEGDDADFLVPLYQGLGTHYAYVWVGTPPQRKSVIVDTGSSKTAFPCVGCEGCGENYHTDAYFQPSQSSTFRRLNCSECYDHGTHCDTMTNYVEGTSSEFCIMSERYAEGSSWSAYGCSDVFYAGGNFELDDPTIGAADLSIRFAFGCKTSVTGLFRTQLADGIMGMGANDVTLNKALYDTTVVPRNIFSLCFVDRDGASKDGVAAGAMTLGGVDERLHASPVAYAAASVYGDWYVVTVRRIYIRGGGGRHAWSESGHQHENATIVDAAGEVINSGRGIIVDSGTTNTYLSSSIKEAFNDAWEEATGDVYQQDAMHYLSEDDVHSLPTVLFQLQARYPQTNQTDSGEIIDALAGSLDPENPNDVLVAMPGTHYMQKRSRDMYASQLYFTESSGGVLGANFMEGHDVIFDWENLRLGFAESECSYDNVTGGTDKEIDCKINPPVLREGCAASTRVCNSTTPDGTVVEGTELWAYHIAIMGVVNGTSCSTVFSARAVREGFIFEGCDDSECLERRRCSGLCQNDNESSTSSTRTFHHLIPWVLLTLFAFGLSLFLCCN